MPKSFTLHRSKDKQFYFTLHGKNGKVIVTSETYTRKGNAIGGIKAVLSALGKVFKDALIADKTK